MSLSKNTLWNIAGNAVPLVIGAVTIPLLIQRLGIERFGILTLLWTIIGYFSLFDFGIGRAITQQVSGYVAAQKHEEIPSTIKAGLEFTILTGLLGMLILLLAAYPLSHRGLSISVELHREVFLSLIIAAIGIPFATFSSGQRGALEGYENFQSSNLARMFLGISIFLFPFIAFIIHGPSLIFITLWLVGARVLSCLLLAWLVGRLPSGNFWPVKIMPGTRKRLFSFGAWMAITNLVSPLLVNADRFVVSYLMGAAVVAYYTVPLEFLVRLLILPGALGTSLLPKLTRDNLSRNQQADKTFWVSVKVVAVVMLALCMLSSALAYPLMKIFISEDFASKAWLLCLILSGGILANSVAYIPYTALHAMGYAKPTGVLHAAELCLYLPVLYLLVKYFGLVGAATAWSARTTVDAIALFILYRKKRGENVLP
jgi:O-antigen/teichoic acid export membrane protein